MPTLLDRIKAAQASGALAGVVETAEKSAVLGTVNADIPDGKYTCVPTKAELGKSQRGDDQVSWTWLVIEGECVDKSIYDWSNNLSDDTRLEYFIKRLITLGYDARAIFLENETPEGVMQDIEDTLDDLVSRQPAVQIVVKTNRDKEDPDKVYKNVYVNKVLEDYERPSQRAASPPATAGATATGSTTEEAPKRGRGRPKKGDVTPAAAMTAAATAYAPPKDAEPETEAEAEAEAEEEAEAKPEEDTGLVEPKPGDTARFKLSGAEVDGEVLEVLEDDGILRVRYEGKVYKLKPAMVLGIFSK
jgi:hypothetical protein